MNLTTKHKRILITFIILSFIGGLIRVNMVCRNELVDVISTKVYAEDIIETPKSAEIEPIITEPIKYYDDETVDVLTNLLYGEARGVKDKSHKAGVIWCVLNRYDNGHYGKTIIEVATTKNQFLGYVKGRTYKSEIAKQCYDECKEIVIDVLDRYYTAEQIGRVLPKNYLYFYADKTGIDNVFRDKFNGDYNIWDWSLPSPY